MATAIFRFYEELNDFLESSLRKRPFHYACARRATVKQAIEALGVPHTEVEVILVNGESVDFSHMIREGDRISVYPMFESLDVTPILKLRDRPLRTLRFIADAHLGLLAKYLRLLGFDTLYARDLDDRGIARIAAAEGRVVLTRDRDLLMHKAITHGCYIRYLQPKRQLRYVVERLDLGASMDPFRRCLECNTELERADEATVAARVAPGPRRLYDTFYRCRRCDKVYWQGSHYRHMEAFVEELKGADHGFHES